MSLPNPAPTSPAAHMIINSTEPEDLETITNDDAAWALTCAFLILTMQTGFAMLECGCVSAKNVSNIMIKNVVDVSLGGLTYWMFGYGISFGQPANWFMGMGGWFFEVTDVRIMGSAYTHYFFQLSFATTATTIVSGAVAERMKLHAYMIFSLVNTVVYCFPACWAWNNSGFLFNLGFYDFAGACVCHLCGGASALVSVLMLGSRLNRFEEPDKYEMSSPVTCLTGMFMLWWAWLGFNCGSTFGVTGSAWKVGAMVAVTTTNGAIGGGLAGLMLSMLLNKGKVIVGDIVNSCLGGLVGITAIASVTNPLESLIIGTIGGLFGMMGGPLMVFFRIDDPVGAIPVHLCAAFWGTISVGLFGRDNAMGALAGRKGLFHGGGFYLLGVQVLGAVCVAAWSGILTFIFLFCIEKTMGIRMSIEEEILGADWCEHDLRAEGLGNKLESALRALDEEQLSKAVENVVKEINEKPLRKITGRQRIFASDRMDLEIPRTPRNENNTTDLIETTSLAGQPAWGAGMYTQIFTTAAQEHKERMTSAKSRSITVVTPHF